MEVTMKNVEESMKKIARSMGININISSLQPKWTRNSFSKTGINGFDTGAFVRKEVIKVLFARKEDFRTLVSSI